MHKAALIYNPAAGGRRERRTADVECAAAVLRQAGVETIVVATTSPGSASEQAMQAAAAGCDTIIACGGDGTIHDSMQRLVSERSSAALGVLPLGTGNALANDLGLPRDPARAAHALLDAEPRRIAVGQAEYADSRKRYFIVTAGVGGDAHMLYKLTAEFKQRHGMRAYYGQAAWLFVTHPFPPFEVELVESTSKERRKEVVAQLLAVRIRHFGGLIRNLAPGAELQRDELRLVLFRSPRRASFLIYLLGRFLGATWHAPGVDLVWADEVICRYLDPSARAQLTWRGRDWRSSIYAEVDGELIGGLPVKLSAVANALNLLVPRRKEAVRE
jgi:diacylglycerol kinase (ATP)